MPHAFYTLPITPKQDTAMKDGFVDQRLVSRIVLSTASVVALACASACAQQPTGPVTPTGKTDLETGWKLTEVTRGLMRPWGAA